MIKIENIKVYNIAWSVYSARNAMNSWDKSDSDLERDILGKNDIDLARKLFKAGAEHRKYLRSIIVRFNCVAPLYWYKEFETYKIGTVSNGCSTMHKLHAKALELDDFSHEHLLPTGVRCLENTIEVMNNYRITYLETRDKDYWCNMIQLLPSSYNQRRSITMNYENVANMIHQRSGHKLDEWIEFVKILKSLPYVEEIMGDTDGTDK